MNKMAKQKTAGTQKGFTLVELLIGIAVSSVVLTAVYAVFNAQQKTHANQQGVVDIQQNLRAGMYYLSREIRLTGYDRKGLVPIAGIVQAGPGIFHFTMDIYDDVDDDGDGILDNDPDEIGFNDGSLSRPGEEIIYVLESDADEDGFPDVLTAEGTPEPAVLGRTDVLLGTGLADAVMENVEAISFAYAFDDDNDGLLDRSGGNIIWAVDTDNDEWLDTILDTNSDGAIDINDAPGGVALAAADRVRVDRIRMVRIWMLVRSPTRDNTFVNQETYVLGNKRLTVDDNYRRRLLAASILCRNMGG